ncbi:hypothetical protein Taro_019251 [Colocasia esculenta]|uniref:Uncharacterized protein n=1 Tax=Colocasia esculenta TaxID=4460 RepID=A0A843UVU5_COLES|nr:hypothetical protein [Colocasia esculenta]
MASKAELRMHITNKGLDINANFWDRVFKLVQIIEPLYEVLRVVDEDRRPTIGLVYAKIEAVNKIREVSPRYVHLILDVVEDRWDQQMSRDLHIAAYYLHLAYYYVMELSYDDDLTTAFTQSSLRQMKSFREGVGSFAEPSTIAGRDRIEGDDPKRGKVEHGWQSRVGWLGRPQPIPTLSRAIVGLSRAESA